MDGRMGWTFTLKGEGVQSSYSHLKSARGSGTYKRGMRSASAATPAAGLQGPLHFEVAPVSTLRHYGAFARELPPAMTADSGPSRAIALNLRRF